MKNIMFSQCHCEPQRGEAISFFRDCFVADLSKLRLLAMTVLLLLTHLSSVEATTYFVDGQLSADCSGGTYSITNRNCSGTNGTAFTTIQKAANISLQAGDIVQIRGGVYRESVTVKSSGASNNYLTFQAFPHEHVVVDGSEPLTGWQACSACSNPNIYYTTINWNTWALFEDDVWLTNAREPDFGYFNGTSGEPFNYISDTQNLVEDRSYYVGAKVELLITSDRGSLGTYFDKLIVNETEPGKIYITPSNITAWAPWDNITYIGTNPYYYFHNKVEYIDRPGEWSLDMGTTPYTVYLWPLKGGNPNQYKIEASKRSAGITTSTWPTVQSYVAFDGIDVTKVNRYDWYGTGYYLAGGVNITIKNANITYNAGAGITNRNPDGHQFLNNTVAYNLYGIGNGGGAAPYAPANMTIIKGNHIHHNGADGITIYRETNFTIADNRIHHHMSDFTHTDNFQTWNDADIILINNTIHDGGQDVIMQATNNITFRNNIVYNSHAHSFVFDDATQENLLFEGNTIGFSGFAPMNLANNNETFKNNLLSTGYSLFGINSQAGHLVYSDYNYFADSYTRIGYGGQYYQINNWVNDMGFDQHSIFGGAQLKNIPLAQIETKPFCAREELCITNANTKFNVGDVIEYNNDGVVRRVTSVQMDRIGIDPPLDYDNIGSFWGGYVLHWGGNTNVEEDWRPLGGDICIGSDTSSFIGALPCVQCESQQPVSLFNVDTNYGYDPLTVNFDASFSKACAGSIIEYRWDFGDGTTGSGINPQHIFSKGVFNVTLTVINTNGLSSSFNKMISVLPQAVPGLNLYLNLDNNTQDLSGKNNHGAWMGAASYVAGKSLEAAAFTSNTTSSYILVKDDELLRGMNELTIALWAKKNTAAIGGTMLLKHVHYSLSLAQSQFSYYVSSDSAISYSGGSAAINDTNWHHYAIAYNGGELIGYVDGIEIARKVFTGVIRSDASRDVIIGKDPWGNGFGGSLDDVRIYSRALSSTEIQALYNDQPPIKYGDVSGDSIVSAYDAALVAQASVGLVTLTATQSQAAEVSGDAIVSAYDAALISQYAVGLLTKFPVEL